MKPRDTETQGSAVSPPHMARLVMLGVTLCAIGTYVAYQMMELPATQVYGLGKDGLDTYLASRGAYLLSTLVVGIGLCGILTAFGVAAAHRQDRLTNGGLQDAIG